VALFPAATTDAVFSRFREVAVRHLAGITSNMEVPVMKTAWQLFSGAVAAAQLTGAVWAGAAWAATPAGAPLTYPASQASAFAADLAFPESQTSAFETALANPADPTLLGDSKDFASIVPGASAGGVVVPSAFNAAGGCDSCGCGDGCGNGCDCGSGCGNACDCGSGVLGFFGSDGAPRWKASAGGVFLSRSQPVPSIIGDPIAGVVGVRATDFSIGTTVGLDLSVARRFTERGSLEARYLGGLEWDVRGSLSDIQGLNLGNVNLPGIIDIGGGYQSTLHSTELNWRQQRSEQFSWLVGFRWIELQDTVSFFVTAPFLDNALAWNTNNHLYGGQIGGNYVFWESSRRPLTLEGSAKGGVYGNDADNDFSYWINGTRVVQGGAFDDDVAFVTEAALWVNYRINDRWTARAGGQFLYIDGVAIGTDQVAASLVQANENVLDNSGYVYYMGGLVSLDYVW
jgi:hypothetical protein